MPKVCFNVFTNCTDADREDEFNRWYSHTHLPDLRQTFGFRTARRFVNAQASPDDAKYWAQYEFEADTPFDALLSLLDNAMTAYRTGRHIDCIKEATPNLSGVLWQEIDPDSLTPLDETKMNYPTEPPEEIATAIAGLRASSGKNNIP